MTAKKPQVDPLPMPDALLRATPEADIVEIPARTVIAIDGTGEPGGAAFQSALRALYGIAYTTRFARKGTRRPGFRIGPLEGHWWIDEARPGTWKWRLRLAVPDDVDASEIAAAADAATRRKRGALVGNRDVAHVFVERIAAMRVARALHVGPYATAAQTLASIADAIAVAHRGPGRAHSEIYLSDPRRTKPERLRTVLLVELARPRKRAARAGARHASA